MAPHCSSSDSSSSSDESGYDSYAEKNQIMSSRRTDPNTKLISSNPMEATPSSSIAVKRRMEEKSNREGKESKKAKKKASDLNEEKDFFDTKKKKKLYEEDQDKKVDDEHNAKLDWLIRFNKSVGNPSLEDEIIRDGLELIAGSKGLELEEERKQLRLEEAELYWKRVELNLKVVKLIRQ